MSTATRLFCMWMHRTLLLICCIVFVIDLIEGFGGLSFLVLIPGAVNAIAAELHRRMLEHRP